MRGLILDNFGFRATEEQEKASRTVADFLFSRDAEGVFVLRGYAGTGKTSIVGALVRSLVALKQKVVLMAPTGRAAKVFSLHAGHPAFTIHKRIYRQKAFSGEMTDFLQGVNLMHDALFIVDEASMIAGEASPGSVFGTGCLLDDLIHYVYSGDGCRLMLVGDTAQLPPVGVAESPALSADVLAGYGLHVTEATLTQVVRQLSASGILWNATQLRRIIASGATDAFPRLRLADFADVVHVPGGELIEALEQAYYHSGTDQTIIITRSNARANAYNNGVRARILSYDTELAGGDQVIVVKNNYHWFEEDFIANGDVAVVRRMRAERSEHGFRFADVTLRFPDYDDKEVEATLLLDTLQSEAPALTREQQETLFQRVWDDYPELTTKRERMKAVKQDPYFNALQVKYAYAITCHKAQGGQWQRVFVDQGYLTEEMLSPDYFRWLYTALTRATETVYLVNWPRAELDADSQAVVSDEWR